MENEHIKESVKAGFDSAYEKDRRGDKPKRVTPEKENIVKALRQTDTMSMAQIYKTAGITRSLYYRLIQAF